MRRTIAAPLAGLMLLSCAPEATGQEATRTPSATQPGKGVFIMRERVSVRWYTDDPAGRDLLDVQAKTTLAYGINGRLAVYADVPVLFRTDDNDAGSDDEFGLDDSRLYAKYRLYQNDSTALDTARVSLLAGVEAPTGRGAFTGGSWDPMLGLAYTQVKGRHGWNLAGRWLFTTGEGSGTPVGPGQRLSDLAQVDAAYLYRIAPDAFTSAHDESWYLVAELNSEFETNGDSEVRFAPGILYEGRRIAAEAGIEVPVWSDLDERPATEFGLIVGIRVLF